MLLIRTILILILLNLSYVKTIEIIHDRGQQLAIMGNLPHRTLGALYWAHILQPHRDDYAYDYLIEWMAADSQERLLEGQTRPVVPMYAVKIAEKFPQNKDLQNIKFVMQNTYLKEKPCSKP